MKLNFSTNPTFRFVLPAMCECITNNLAGMVFSAFIGGISASSLTTMALGNQVINLICAAASMLVTGSSILCSRMLGAGEHADASRVVEQTLLLSAISSFVITVLCLIFTVPLMTLLMPNADEIVLKEGVAFFRVLILSLPFLMINNVNVTAMRASGDGRTPLFIAVFMSGLLMFFAWLFLRIMHLDIVGAGLAYLWCRIIGAFVGFLLLMRSTRYTLSIRKILKPHIPTFKRILNVGIPTSIESLFVQMGYLVANSMIIGLGTFEAAVYNVANTLYTFASLPQSISSTVTPVIIGHLIGARNYKQARHKGWHIWIIGMISSFIISVTIALCGAKLTPIYSNDAEVQAKAVKALWVVVAMCVPAISLNTLDPQLRTGGDVKYVMCTTLIAVWLIRLPLTYLLCYIWNMGASGVFLANTIALLFRMVFNMARFIKGKYLYMKV